MAAEYLTNNILLLLTQRAPKNIEDNRTEFELRWIIKTDHPFTYNKYWQTPIRISQEGSEKKPVTVVGSGERNQGPGRLTWVGRILYTFTLSFGQFVFFTVCLYNQILLNPFKT